MAFDDILEISLLFDFYGELLSNRQREVMTLYHEENLSLSEIADEFEISRQGVHDTLKKAESALYGYEEKLGLVSRFESSNKLIQSIDSEIAVLINENGDNEKLIESLSQIRALIDSME